MTTHGNSGTTLPKKTMKRVPERCSTERSTDAVQMAWVSMWIGRTVSFQNFMFVFAAKTLAIWNSRQYGQTSNVFAFRIWDAQFEI